MSKVTFENYSIQCKDEIKDICIQWLHEAAQVILRQILDIYRVDTGQTKNSFDYKVDEGELECAIGSDEENAIWEEFGTGIYAEDGSGRKTPWSYQDAKGEWHTTEGKRGTSAFRRSFDMQKKALQDRFESLLGGLK